MISEEHRLLIDEDGVVHVPFLVKGQPVMPRRMNRAEVEAAFSGVEAGTHYIEIPDAQLIREAIIDRGTMVYTSGYLYQVLPALQPFELVDTDFDGLVSGPYAQPVEEVLRFLQKVGEALQANGCVLERTRELSRHSSEHPDVFLDLAFAALQSGFDPMAARTMIDQELSFWNIPGSHFLDGWVEVPGDVIPGVTPILRRMLPGNHSISPPTAGPPCLRAMPTRQLHITAGNAPEVPWVSALRLILSKSAGVVKMPYGSTLSGGLLALAVAAAAPDHPLAQHLSIVYWQGGDQSIENVLLAPGAFDRIVVWGAPDAVASVQSRAGMTKTVCFNPRYGASLIGREAFSTSLEAAVYAAAADVMIYSQKACTASLVQYVEGSRAQAEEFAGRLAAILHEWDQLAPPFVLPAARGQIRRMKRGRYSSAQWMDNETGGSYTSGVVLMPGEFNILDHPMSRLVVVRQVDDIRDALLYLHAGVSTVGVYPEGRRLALREAIAARGVSSILTLGQCEQIFPGGPQDGMIVLSELVDWKYA